MWYAFLALGVGMLKLTVSVNPYVEHLDSLWPPPWTTEDAQRVLSQSGEEGRRAYLGINAIDMFFPFIYGAIGHHYCRFAPVPPLLKKSFSSLAQSLCVVAVVADLCENM